MRMLKHAAYAGALLLASLAVPASAQRPIELGIDGMVALHEIRGSTLLEVAGPMGGILTFAPLQAFRLGVFVSDRLSVEPSLGLNIVDEEDDDAWTRLGASTSVLYHFGQNAMPGPFVGVGGSFTLYDEGDAANQLGVHTLLGANVAIAPNFFFRMTAGAGHAFENDDFEPRWTYFATVGLSHTVGGSTSALAIGKR